jgi:hypothetical protein
MAWAPALDRQRYMKTMIDLNDEALELAARALGLREKGHRERGAAEVRKIIAERARDVSPARWPAIRL